MTNTITILAIAVLVLGPLIIIGSAFAEIVTVGVNPLSGLFVIERDTTTVQIVGFGDATLTLTCNSGETAIGATYKPSLPDTNSFVITTKTFPVIGSDPSAWQIQLVNDRNLTIDVDVSALCAKVSIANGAVGGFLLEPDSTALFLAYGIANAIWIAPTMAGLAAGIYLTKNKWKR